MSELLRVARGRCGTWVVLEPSEAVPDGCTALLPIWEHPAVAQRHADVLNCLETLDVGEQQPARTAA